MAVIGIGRHLVQVASHVLGRSGTKGTPHVAVLFEDANGDRITWYGYLTDAALEGTMKALGVLGWDPMKFDGRVDSLNGTDLLRGQEAEIVVEMEEWNGEPRPKVKWVNEPGGGGLGDGMSQDEASSFAADLRQRILSAPKPKVSAAPGHARPRPSAAVPAGVDDDLDDLPF